MSTSANTAALGGVPLSIAVGAPTLAVLRSGLNAVGARPFVNDIAMAPCC
jgi:hypothetical protein